MAGAVELELGGVVEYLATQIDGNFIPSPTDGDDEKLTHQSAALMDEANLSFSQYHVIRMFVYRMWKVRIGAPCDRAMKTTKQRSSLRQQSHQTMWADGGSPIFFTPYYRCVQMVQVSALIDDGGITWRALATPKLHGSLDLQMRNERRRCEKGL